LSWSATLRLDNTAGVLTRLNTATAPTLTMAGGALQLLGNSAASPSETFGAMTLGGAGTVTVLGASAAAQTTSVTFASPTRPTTGSLSITATNLGSGTGAGESIIRFTADPGGRTGGTDTPGTPAVRILPYAVANFAGSTSTTTVSVNSGLVRWDSGSQRIV